MANKVFTYADIKKESDSENATLIVIHDGVYNVTEFLNEVSRLLWNFATRQYSRSIDCNQFRFRLVINT